MQKDLTKHLRTLSAQRWRFLALFLVVFFCTSFMLALVGFVPEYSRGVAYNQSLPAEASGETSAREPQHITIPRVGINAQIGNPQSRDTAVLDRALQSGVVHYPGTGTLVEDANIFMFGHSSYLPNVINKNYQIFNNLQKLEHGDEIFVDSDNVRYVYRVTSVSLAEASDITIDLSRGVRKLTLSTCNSFGDKSERYVVEALYVGSYLLSI